MISFKNDYSEGAHPQILSALLECNLEQSVGYGEDRFTMEANELLKKRIGRSDVDIHMLSGGTQTNLTAISAFLRPHEAAISANTGHVLVHETGAIEATGHKVISMDVQDGKMTAALVQSALDTHTDEHMVKPRLVYISNPTEIGTIYTKSELRELSHICREKDLYLYMDGARLGSALCSVENDLTLEDIGALTDAFYIGGTKCGALLGEALVICRDSLKTEFRYHLKQKGGLLAKGRLLGIQFLELFRENLYFELSAHANAMAGLLKTAFDEAGYPFLTHSTSNQIFPILPNALIDELQSRYDFYVWSRVDEGHSSIRLVTSWATPEEAIQEFIGDMNAYRDSLAC